MPGTDATHLLNSRAGFFTKSLGDRARLQVFVFHWINLPLAPVTSEFHRHLCEEKCIEGLEDIGVARVRRDMFQVEAGDFIGYPAGGEAHDLHNTGSSHMICIIVGQRLGFDVVDYQE